MEEDVRKIMQRVALALLPRVLVSQSRRIFLPAFRSFISLSLITLINFSSAQDGMMGWINKALPYKLPSEPLSFEKLKPRSPEEVLDADGKPLFYLGAKTGHLQFYRPLNSIDPKLIQFVVLLEDAKFYQHDGLDVSEIKKAIQSNIEKGKTKRGGSTISQQLVKNLFLDKEKSIVRKLFELPWVNRIEEDLSKRQILDLYLNIIEWGPGIYGAEAAARHFFDKGSADLSISEALALALIIPNPKRFDPYLGPRNLAFIEKKKVSFVDRIISEKVISSKDRSFILSEKTSLAPLSQIQRSFPLSHTGSYYPNNSKEKKDLLEQTISYLGPYVKTQHKTHLVSLSKATIKMLSEIMPEVQINKKDPLWLLQKEGRTLAFVSLPQEILPISIPDYTWEKVDKISWKDLHQ